MFPSLFETARLVLRPITAADADAVFETYAQDPEVTRFLTWRPHRSRAETAAYVAACAAATAARTYVLLSRSEGRLCGAFDLRRTGPARFGFGYVLARPCWGQGLMTEALGKVCRWALCQDGIWRIGDVCDVDNRASARVMEKAGLALEGRLRRWAVHPSFGEAPRDCLSFAAVR